MKFSKQVFNLNYKIRPLEFLLGTGLGLGYMTSLRFFGPVGASELLILLSLLLLFAKQGKSLFMFEKGLAGAIKIYMITAIFIILPIMTLTNILFLGLNVAPEYIISFMMGIALAFLIVEALRSKIIHMPEVVFWFALIFLVTNFISLTFFAGSLASSSPDTVRYSGAADNPNQLMFYASCLSLFLVV